MVTRPDRANQLPDGAPSSAGKRNGPDLHISIQARGVEKVASSRPDTRPHLTTCLAVAKKTLASEGRPHTSGLTATGSVARGATRAPAALRCRALPGALEHLRDGSGRREDLSREQVSAFRPE